MRKKESPRNKKQESPRNKKQEPPRNKKQEPRASKDSGRKELMKSVLSKPKVNLRCVAFVKADTQKGEKYFNNDDINIS